MIYPGSEVHISAEFKRTDTGQLSDPTTVMLRVRNPRCSEAPGGSTELRLSP